MYDPRPASGKIVFLHVAKTGGSTFRRIVSDLYGASFHICQDRTIEGIEATLAKFNAVEFHGITTTTEWFRPFGEIVRLGRWDLLEGAEVFTMLRDPVDRYISNYHYMLSHREFTEAAMAKHGFKFPESLEEMMSLPNSYNIQIEFLLGKRAQDSIPVNREDLEALKKMLLRLKAHVGLTERYAESVHIFETVTGRRVPGNLIRNVNRTPNRPPLEAIPAEVRNLIRERSALEQELYDFGRELFLADLERCGPVKAFRFEEEAQAPIAAPVPAIDLPKPLPGLWSRLRGALLPFARR